MIKKILLVLAVLAVTGLIFNTSCTEKTPTKGTLGITVLKATDGSAVQSELLYLSRSYQDMNNKVYSDSGWTDANGFIRFHQRDPGMYWYRVKHWTDFGAARVINATDIDVILMVDSPDTTIHK